MNNPQTLSPKKQLLSKATLILTAAIWGAGFVFSQMALDAGFGPAALLLGKFGIATVMTAALFWRAIRANISRRAIVRGAIAGLVLAGAFFAQTFGLKYSTPSNCALITAAYVVITPFLWKLIFRRKLRPVIYIASALCFFGVAFLTVDISGGVSLNPGDLFTLFSAVLFAVQLVITEAYIGEMDYRLLLFIQFTAAALCCLAVYLLTERRVLIPLSWKGSLSVAYLGVFSTCLCFLLQTSAQRYVNSGAVALILSLESMFGAVFSVLLGYDPPSLQMLIGGGAILISVVLPELIRIKPDIHGGGAMPPALDIETKI